MPLHLKAGDGDLPLIVEPALPTRCAWSPRSIYRPALIIYISNVLFFILMIRDYSSWKSKIQYLKIVEYLHLSFIKWHYPYSINSRYLLFFETTIMGNTADMAMVQKTIIDTLHKEGKSQRVITGRCGCSRSAVSKHIKCKVYWKEEIGLEKVHKQQGWPQAWENCQAKLIQTLGRASQGVNWSWSQCIKSHHAQTSSGKGVTKPLLKQKQSYLG